MVNAQTLKKMSERLVQILELLDSSPRDSFLLFAAAKEYEKMEDLEEALDYYALLEQSDPAYVGLYYHLGKLLEKLGREQEALQAYERGMRVAQAQGDRHSHSELSGAKLNLELGE
jgi:tetratricopeptide (TPR) repeat protein